MGSLPNGPGMFYGRCRLRLFLTVPSVVLMVLICGQYCLDLGMHRTRCVERDMISES